MTVYVACKNWYNEITEPVVVFEDKLRAKEFVKHQNTLEDNFGYSWSVDEVPFEQ